MRTLECHNSFINCVIPSTGLSLPKRATGKMNSNVLREKSRLFYKSSVTDWFLINFKNNQD